MRELRNATLSQSGLLASLEEPRARERTVTEDVSPHALECSRSDNWQPGEVRCLPPDWRVSEARAKPSGLLCSAGETAAIVWE